jgi:glutathione reductase (NADPH)
MADFDFDLFTIGAGSGGVAASRRAGSYGARVALCEEGRVGGTCVLRGCVPKKLLVYGSHYADEFADARGFGWTVSDAAHDWPALIAAKDRELERLEGIYRRMLADAGVTLIAGRARLVDGHTVLVGDRRYTAKHVLVATGGWPSLPKLRGIEHAITSNEALDLRSFPRRVAVVGGGYIAVEFAGIFRSFGAEVTILVRGDGILRGFDSDARSFLATEMQKRGVVIRPDVSVADIEKRPDGSLLLCTKDGESLEVDQVLYATGRAPNTRGIGLEEAGVKLDPSGAVVVDEWSQSSIPGVYAVGDCTDRINLTPVAIMEGRAVAETLFHDNPTPSDHELVPSAVFSQPPLASVGCSEQLARERHGAIDVYVTSFRALKHAIGGRDERTMMKLVVERASQRVVGAHMVGADAPEIVQGIAIALRCGATKKDFDRTVGIHPTAAEEFVTMRERRPDPHPRGG